MGVAPYLTTHSYMGRRKTGEILLCKECPDLNSALDSLEALKKSKIKLLICSECKQKMNDILNTNEK